MRNRYHNSTFVDNNAIAAPRNAIMGAIDNSFRAAYDVFGHPHDNRRYPCISEEKMMMMAHFLVIFLGFCIHTRNMTIWWPVKKRQQLATLIDEILQQAAGAVSPQQCASLLGLVRNAAAVCPVGVYLSLRLQYTLNDTVKLAWTRAANQSAWWRHWWWVTKFKLKQETIQDLRLLRSKLSMDPNDPTWNWYIGFLVKRIANALCYSLGRLLRGHWWLESHLQVHVAALAPEPH